MNKRVFTGNKKAVMTGWKRVSYDDITKTAIQANLSSYATMLIKDFSHNLGISETRFIEIAITSATIGSSNWNTASNRFERVRQERSYLKMLKGRLIKRQNKDSEDIKPESSELKELFERIVNDNIYGKQLEQLLHSKGLAFTSKNITYEETDGNEDDEEEEG
jgi:hypothetical protein